MGPMAASMSGMGLVSWKFGKFAVRTGGKGLRIGRDQPRRLASQP
jgi:hypothetical protein